MNNSPLYGADVSGSLFDKGVAWNLAEIQTLLSKGLGDVQIKGVSDPYVYIGQWKAMFGWHKEDLDLYSINYLHHGKPKFWYSINLTDNQKVESFMQKRFPENYKRCKEFIRHKTTMVSPKVLQEEGMKMVKGLHLPNEFMISRCAAYHSGFNFGFNIAEAVNFAAADWIPVAKKANHCRCIGDSVKIDLDYFLQNLER